MSDLPYCPIDTWTGRLILPTPEQRTPDGAVFLEVHNAAPEQADWVGRVVQLCWSQDPEVQSLVQAVTGDVQFTHHTWLSQKQGNLHPDRLNGWKAVGPLESLAGARPADDVTVLLRRAIATPNPQGTDSLIIDSEPVQITGKLMGLVTLVEPAGEDHFWVSHFNKASHQFDGAKELIRIPQATPDSRGVCRSSNRGLERSPLNPQGWYIYGQFDGAGMFVVGAIEPRALMQLQPNWVCLGLKPAAAYIYRKNWRDTNAKKGTAQTALVSAEKTLPGLETLWQEGDAALVMHLYGGIGGKKGEPAPFGLVPGHFAYGIAWVVRDPLTDGLRFDIEYKQIYGHNPDGIIAGSLKWSCYAGDLQRGWLGSRPISDVLIKLDALTQPYDFDGVTLWAIAQFSRQLEAMTARYRIGHGTGVALINLATSCVQDSNQALYITIHRIRQFLRATPQVQTWLRSHPNHPQTQRFRKLTALGRLIERELVPFWIVRPDWHRNVVKLFTTRSIHNVLDTLLRGVLTWRTAMPRRAYDDMLHVFLKQGAVLWFIRTNQVGGEDPDIQPRAPRAFVGYRNQ